MIHFERLDESRDLRHPRSLLQDRGIQLGELLLVRLGGTEKRTFLVRTVPNAVLRPAAPSPEFQDLLAQVLNNPILFVDRGLREVVCLAQFLRPPVRFRRGLFRGCEFMLEVAFQARDFVRQATIEIANAMKDATSLRRRLIGNRDKLVKDSLVGVKGPLEVQGLLGEVGFAGFNFEIRIIE
jgi:hypothetical protein